MLEFFLPKKFPWRNKVSLPHEFTEVRSMEDKAQISSTSAEQGWRHERTQPTLPEVYGSLKVPTKGSWIRKFLAFVGPGYLVAVGYMDPGNWATDIAGGSMFGYTLLSVILLSNLMAILLQALAGKLGIVTGRDLAQACRDHYSKPVAMVLWVLCELAIAACDLAEVIGSAIALNLLFGIPLIYGVIITVVDVLIVLLLQNKGFRYIETLVIVLIVTIGGCFITEIFLSKPDVGGIMHGFVPNSEIITNPVMLYIAIGILGATVMPHNLYLHSSIVQTRQIEQTSSGKRQAIKFAAWDSSIALFFALFINAAILIISAATFHKAGLTEVAEIGEAYHMRFRSKLHVNRDISRSDRNGGLPQYSSSGVAAPIDHAADRHHPGGYRNGYCRGKRNGAAAYSQSGHSIAAAILRRYTAYSVHKRSKEDGRIRQSIMVKATRLDCSHRDRKLECLSSVPNLFRLVS
jgi:NRAMP (natural resistance-associated macrophage protein)-like metal ion transporter